MATLLNPMSPGMTLSPTRGVTALPIAAAIGLPLLSALVFLNEANLRIAAADDVRFDLQVLVRLAVCAACGLYGLIYLRQATRQLLRLPGLFLVAFASWALITAPLAWSPKTAMASSIALWCVLLYAAALCRNVRPSRWLAAAIFGLTVYVIGSWIAFHGFPAFGRDPYDESAMGGDLRFGGLSHPNNTGRLCALALALATHGLLQGFLRRRTALPLAALFAVTLLRTGSRTSLLAAAAAVGLCLARRSFVQGRAGRGFWIVGMTAGLVLSVFVAGYGLGVIDSPTSTFLSRFARSGDVEELTSLSGRTDLWNYVWWRIQRSPILGYGLGCTRFVIVAGHEWETHHAHNVLLNVTLGTGIVGLVPLAGALLWMATAAVRRRCDVADIILTVVVVLGMADVSILHTLPDACTGMWLLALFARDACAEQGGSSGSRTLASVPGPGRIA